MRLRLLPLCLVTVLVPAAAAHARVDAGPVNTSPPAIVGTPKVEAPLSATPGTWTDAGPIAYAYAWEECDANGASCMPLPYDTQSIASLHAVVGQTVRVVVTATAADGSATVTSAPKVVVGAGGAPGAPRPGHDGGGGGGTGGLKVTFVRPRPHAIVRTPRFAVVIRVQGATGPIRVHLDSDVGGAGGTVTGKGPTFSFPVGIVNGQVVHLEASASASGKTGKATEAVSVEPPVTAVQDPSGSLTAPGCGTCLVRDPRGDGKGVGPDIASAASSVAGDWITLTVTTYDAVRNSAANAGHPCIQGWPLVNGQRSSFGIGCFQGPHTDQIFGGCAHPDANHDCGPFQTSYPTAHTVRYRFRASEFPGAWGISWQVWVLYPGDQLKDTLPSVAHLGNDPAPNCFIITEWRAQPAGAYRFGKGRCPQAGIVVAKPAH